MCKCLSRQMFAAVCATVDWYSLSLYWLNLENNAVSYVIISHILSLDSSSLPTLTAECSPQRLAAAAAAAVSDEEYGFLSLVLVSVLPHVKLITNTLFHHITRNVSERWVWMKTFSLISKWVFSLPVPRLYAVFLNPTENSLLTPTLWQRPAALLPTRPQENCQMHRAPSSNQLQSSLMDD